MAKVKNGKPFDNAIWQKASKEELKKVTTTLSVPKETALFFENMLSIKRNHKAKLLTEQEVMEGRSKGY